MTHLSQPAAYAYINAADCKAEFIIKSAKKAIIETHFDYGVKEKYQITVIYTPAGWKIDSFKYGFENEAAWTNYHISCISPFPDIGLNKLNLRPPLANLKILEDFKMIVNDIELGEFGLEGVMEFPLFDCEITVRFDEDVPTEYAQKCAEYLSHLPNATIDKLCEFSIIYCEDYREYFEDEEITIPENISGRDILKHIRPSSLLVDTPEGEGIGFRMELNCDWEEEHGMEWVINNGEVLFVGGYTDENPWRDKEYFKNAGWNYAVIA